MKGFLGELRDLGVTATQVVRISGLSMATLRKIDSGSTHLRPTTLARARRTMNSIKAELELAPVLKRAAGNNRD